ncbi:FAD binding domain-containing protein [Bradyrhizobium denitrificans]
MKPAPFRLERPNTVQALCQALRKHGESARILAGGQSLVPMMNFRLVAPEVLIDINHVDGLDYIRLDGDVLAVGAMTRHAAVKESSLVKANVPLIAKAYAHIAHVTVRNRGTIGGNLSHGDPSSELPTVAICLDATFVVSSSEGSRTVAATDFFKSMFETDVRSGEFLSEIRFPVAARNQRFGFEEFSPRHGDFAIAIAAVALEMKGDTCVSASVVHGGIRDIPGHMPAVEAALQGKVVGSEQITHAAEATLSIEPTLQNYHGDAAYKSDLLRTLTARALSQAVAEG